MVLSGLIRRPSLRVETFRVFPMIRMAMHEKGGYENSFPLRHDKFTRVPILERHAVQQIQGGIKPKRFRKNPARVRQFRNIRHRRWTPLQHTVQLHMQARLHLGMPRDFIPRPTQCDRRGFMTGKKNRHRLRPILSLFRLRVRQQCMQPDNRFCVVKGICLKPLPNLRKRHLDHLNHLIPLELLLRLFKIQRQKHV